MNERSRLHCERPVTVTPTPRLDLWVSRRNALGTIAALDPDMQTQHSSPPAPPAPVYFVDPESGEVIILDLNTATFAPVSR